MVRLLSVLFIVLLSTMFVAAQPTTVDEWNEQGLALRDQGDCEGEIDAFTQAIALDPESVTSLQNRAFSYYSCAGDYEGVIADIDAALALEPDAWSYNLRGLAERNLGDYEAAVEDFTTSFETDETFTVALNNRAGVYYNNLQNYEAALADYTELTTLTPEDAEPWNMQGNSYNLLDMPDEAFESYTQAISINPNEPAYFRNRAAIHYAHLEQYQDAVNDYSTALELDPNHIDARYWRARSFSNLGLINQALEDYNTAIELAPDRNYIYNARGEEYLNMGDLEAALADFTTTLAINPENSTALYNRASTMIALAQQDLATYLELAGEDVTEEQQAFIDYIQATP